MTRRKGDFTRTRKRQVPEGRAKIWQSIRFLGKFSLADLEEASGESDRNCHQYTLALAKAGYLKLEAAANGEPGKTNVYRLIRDTGNQPPIPRVNGQVFDLNCSEVFEPVEVRAPKSSRQKAWELLCRGSEVTVEALAEHSKGSLNGLRQWVRALQQAGYVEACQEGRARWKHYRLAKKTGNLAPVLQRDGSLHDPNQEETNT